jgi:triacylglycerol lipase
MSTKKPDLVIIHGMAASRYVFKQILRVLNKDFECHFFSYYIKETVPEIVRRFEKFVAGLESFNCFTYSFGAIIIRNYAAQFGREKIRRVVMAAPPNKGSELLRIVMQKRIGKRTFGRLARDFIAHEGKYLPLKPELEAGIIAGVNPGVYMSKAVGILVNRLFDTNDSDGKVKIEETKLPYMKDYIEVNYSHDSLFFSKDLTRLTKEFLVDGKFNK